MSDRLRWLLPALAVCAVLCGLAAPAQAQTCAPAWSASQVYTSGNQASLNGVNYTANFWTQNNNPSTSNGPAGSGQPWTSNGTCSGSGGGGGGGGTCATVWSSTQVYTGGMQAGLNGINYQANFWNQNTNPSTNNGPAGSGAPWTNIGSCGGGCTVIPSVPTGLSSPSQTSTSVNLTWNASSSGPNCTVQYRVFQNGSLATTVTGTSVTLSNLPTCNTFTFSVAATDQVGTSNQGNSINVTPPQPSGGCGGGGGTARSAPYVDISLATGSQVAANAATAGLPGITLAFMVDGGCTAVWAGGLGNVSNAMFPNGTSVKSQIDALTNAGRKVIIAWGGANGSVLSSCGSASQAQAMYQSVFNAYPNITGQDFDVEGGVNTTILAQALQGLKSANPSKSISLTLPVLPTGLVTAGLNIVNACHAAGLHPDTINVMAMDYGSANDNGGNMLLSAQQAAQATRNQTGDMIGITPMIGVNDTNTEIFTLANATDLVNWAKGQSYINRLAFWSLSRDNGGCPGQTFASATCSGLSQSNWQFAGIFKGF
jgi:chitodextrinase